MQGVVELLEPTGLGTIVHLTLGTTTLKAFTLARLPLTVGSAMPMDLPADKLHLFDSEGVRVGKCPY